MTLPPRRRRKVFPKYLAFFLLFILHTGALKYYLNLDGYQPCTGGSKIKWSALEDMNFDDEAIIKWGGDDDDDAEDRDCYLEIADRNIVTVKEIFQVRFPVKCFGHFCAIKVVYVLYVPKGLLIIQTEIACLTANDCIIMITIMRGLFHKCTNFGYIL